MRTSKRMMVKGGEQLVHHTSRPTDTLWPALQQTTHTLIEGHIVSLPACNGLNSTTATAQRVANHAELMKSVNGRPRIRKSDINRWTEAEVIHLAVPLHSMASPWHGLSHYYSWTWQDYKLDQSNCLEIRFTDMEKIQVNYVSIVLFRDLKEIQDLSGDITTVHLSSVQRWHPFLIVSCVELQNKILGWTITKYMITVVNDIFEHLIFT